MKTFKDFLDELAPVKVRMDKSTEAKKKRKEQKRKLLVQRKKEKKWQLKVKLLVERELKRELYEGF